MLEINTLKRSTKNLLFFIGDKEPDELEITLATILGHIIDEEEFDPRAGILHHEEGVDLIPANIELSGLEVAMINIISREHLMADKGTVKLLSLLIWIKVLPVFDTFKLSVRFVQWYNFSEGRC